MASSDEEIAAAATLPADVLFVASDGEGGTATAEAVLRGVRGRPSFGGRDCLIMLATQTPGHTAPIATAAHGSATCRVVRSARLSALFAAFGRALPGPAGPEGPLGEEGLWYIVLCSALRLRAALQEDREKRSGGDSESCESESVLSGDSEVGAPAGGGSELRVDGSWFPLLPSFVRYEDAYPELEILKQHWREIQREAASIPQWTKWPEYHFRDGGTQEWKVFPLTYTFPANDPARQKWLPATCAACPVTSALLQSLPRVRTALFSRLGAGTRLSAHTGWDDLANHVLRCHLGLDVPPGRPGGRPPCGVYVHRECWYHREGELLVFDDSMVHGAFNDHPRDSRVVLIVDLERPAWLPRGRAEGGHTAELDKFIAQFDLA